MMSNSKRRRRSANPSRHLPLEKQLSRGEEMLVQVAKDPLGTKGARVTSHVSLPGRYMVFMPGTKHIGISRRIESDDERKRLKEIAQSLGYGGRRLYSAHGLRGTEQARDSARSSAFLQKLWKGIQKKAESAPAPSLIHQDLDLIARTIRDFFSADTEQVVDRFAQGSPAYCRFRAPLHAALEVEDCLYADKEPLFEQLGHRRKDYQSAGPRAFGCVRAATSSSNGPRR